MSFYFLRFYVKHWVVQRFSILNVQWYKDRWKPFRKLAIKRWCIFNITKKYLHHIIDNFEQIFTADWKTEKHIAIFFNLQFLSLRDKLQKKYSETFIVVSFIFCSLRNCKVCVNDYQTNWWLYLVWQFPNATPLLKTQVSRPITWLNWMFLC